MINKTILFLPMNADLYVLKKKNNYKCFFIISKNILYYFIIDIPLKEFYLNKNFNIILFNNFLNMKKLIQYYNKFFINWNNFFFKKIKLNGKGFKIQKKKNRTSLYINYSNPILFINKNFIIKKTDKYKINFYFNNNQYIQILYNLINLRKINIYTKRGIRASRFLIKNRKGKTTSK